MSPRSTRDCLPSRAMCSVLVVCVCLTAILSVPGCGGCRRDSDAAAKKKKEDEEKKKKEQKKKKPKPNFRVERLRVQPFDDTVSARQTKWGHWSLAIQPMKANNFNFQGELIGATVAVQNDVPYDLERTPFRLRTTRPASLPKGQTKFFETTYFVPRRPDREGKTIGLSTRLRGRRGGREVWYGKELPMPMASHQYDLVVLARRADSYAFWKRLDSIDAPWDNFAMNPAGPYYRVLLPKVTEKMPLPLPSQPLYWTTIAYVVWDDVPPDSLSLDQQRALVDWLHWGGQIIISGPGTLDELRGSFLGNYLPADAGSSVKLTNPSFDELNARFTLTEKRGGRQSRHPLTVVDGAAVEGIELRKHTDADFVPHTGELLVERRVGRGRIVVTAFPLTDRRVINWRNFDNFVNACLLRRPPRVFTQSPTELGVRVSWAGRYNAEKWRNDARLVTNLRYFSRDSGKLSRRQSPSSPSATTTTGSEQADQVDAEITGGDTPDVDPFSVADASDEASPPVETPSQPAEVSWDFEADPLFDNGFEQSPQSGVAGWYDFSGTPTEVRQTLKQAAGITVPKAGFVIRVLGIYLLVLVPVNWTIFRIIGRVEWAWLAAPIIAVGGAVAVVYLAQLDIGFVRSRTEIAVLEVQGDYPRGHLTRFTALYTSLSTSYDLQFDEPSALAQPFAANRDYQRLIGQRASEVVFARDQKVSLRDFPVKSNSTGMLHSEQMFDLGGAVSLVQGEGGGWEIVNETNLTLQGAGIIRRMAVGSPDSIEVAWVGQLDPGARRLVRFETATDTTTLLPQWDESPETMVGQQAGDLSLRRLLDLAQDPRRVDVGDTRLVAWTDAPFEGLDIRPRARQAVHRTLVIAHLRYGPLPDPRPDENTFREVATDDELKGN
jgi:hypothetical protein